MRVCVDVCVWVSVGGVTVRVVRVRGDVNEGDGVSVSVHMWAE